MSKKSVLVGLMLSCFFLFTAGTGIADTISYTDNFDNIMTELVNQELRVNKFDSSFGTLNSVSVTWTGDLNSNGTVTNNGTDPQTATISTLVQDFSGTLVGLSSGLDSPFNVFDPFVTMIGSQEYTLDGKASDSFGPAAINNSGFLTATDLNSFIGMGEFGYNFNSTILTTIAGGGGNFAANIETFADASLTVIYDYDATPLPAVPEPATFMLFGLGLLGLAHRIRRNDA